MDIPSVMVRQAGWYRCAGWGQSDRFRAAMNVREYSLGHTATWLKLQKQDAKQGLNVMSVFNVMLCHVMSCHVMPCDVM